MAQHNSTAYTGIYAFQYADGLDDFVLDTDLQPFALAFHDHDHTTGKGLPVGRVAFGLAAARPAAADGLVYICTDTNLVNFAWGGVWQTVPGLALGSIITAEWTFNVAQIQKEIATPANPVAGYLKFYAKADGLLYTLDSSGREAPVGPVPTAVGVPYFGTTLPPNALWMDGHSEVVATYARLSGVIRPTFGGVDAAHFYVPDYRSRSPMGADNFGVGAAGLTSVILSGASGADTHAQASGEMAQHTHTTIVRPPGTQAIYATAQSQYDPGAGSNAGDVTGSAGNGTPMSLRQLVLGCNWIIGV